MMTGDRGGPFVRVAVATRGAESATDSRVDVAGWRSGVASQGRPCALINVFTTLHRVEDIDV
jgi:hypothetical protein